MLKPTLAPAPVSLSRLCVLVADDNRHMRQTLKTVLRALGVGKVVACEDGVQAIQEMRNHAVDVVFCDWQMPPLDGIEFIKLVRRAKDSPHPTVPIVMLTGHTELQRVLEARDAGANEFLAKPISPKGLYMRLLEVMLRPRPFITSATYVGPCRRRRRHGDYHGPERRAERLSQPPPAPRDPNAPLLTEEELNTLLGNTA